MKTKKYFLLAVLLFIILPLLHSCFTSDKVTNSMIIQKRKYNKGYYVNYFSFKFKNNKTIKQNDEKHLVIDTIKIPNKISQSTIESLFLQYEISSTNKTKDIFLTSIENISIKPYLKEYFQITNKNKIIQTEPNNAKVKKNFNCIKKRLNVLTKVVSYEEKPKINNLALAGFGFSLLALITIIISLLLSFMIGVYLSLIFSIPAIILCIFGFIKTRKNNEKGKVLAIIGFILSSLLCLTTVFYVYFILITLFLAQIDGCWSVY